MRRIFPLMGAVISCGLFSAPARAQQSASPAPSIATLPHSIATKQILAGVPNFGEVGPLLFRGGQPSLEGFESLAKRGVNIIVDLREGTREDERNTVTKLGMQYLAIPWHCGHPDSETVARFLAFLRENPEKKIFVHCRLGADRTGMMIAAYRMGEQGWSASDARKEMAAYGFSFSHHLLCPGLADYEQNFPRVFSASPAFEKFRPMVADSSATQAQAKP